MAQMVERRFSFNGLRGGYLHPRRQTSITAYDSIIWTMLFARRRGESFSNRVDRSLTRYELVLQGADLSMVERSHLTAMRRFISRYSAVPIDKASPRMLAALIEEKAANPRNGEHEMREQMALARLVSKMNHGQALALVEACERWCGRPSARPEDDIYRDLIEKE